MLKFQNISKSHEMAQDQQICSHSLLKKTLL